MSDSATREVAPLRDTALLARDDEAVVLITAGSVWIVTPDRYLRMKRDEFAAVLGNETLALCNRLDYDTWHLHRGAWWRARNGTYAVQIRPVAGPADGYGIVTGDVEAAAAIDLADLVDV